MFGRRKRDEHAEHNDPETSEIITPERSAPAELDTVDTGLPPHPPAWRPGTKLIKRRPTPAPTPVETDVPGPTDTSFTAGPGTSSPVGSDADAIGTDSTGFGEPASLATETTPAGPGISAEPGTLAEPEVADGVEGASSTGPADFSPHEYSTIMHDPSASGHDVPGSNVPSDSDGDLLETANDLFTEGDVPEASSDASGAPGTPFEETGHDPFEEGNEDPFAEREAQHAATSPTDHEPIDEPAESDPFITGPDTRLTVQPEVPLLTDGAEFQEAVKRDHRAVWVGVVVLLLAGVGVGTWLVADGRSDDRAARAYDRGERSGQTAGASQFEAGRPGYQRIFDAGRSAGVQSGEQTGRKAGQTAGRRSVIEQLNQTSPSALDPAPQGDAPSGNPLVIRNAGSTALGGFAGWAQGGLYAIRVGEGPGLLPFQIVARSELEGGKLYRICPNRPGRLCEAPVPKAKGVSGQDETSAEKADPSAPNESEGDSGGSAPIDPNEGLPADPTDNSDAP